jgi:TorA maturation chaperone TorD
MIAGTAAGAAMGAAAGEDWLSRADLLLCLSRAFQPPPSHWSVCDWSQPLADDLQDIAGSMPVDVAGVQRALDAECARWAASAQRDAGQADSWLVEYTRLFLVPPIAVPLNAGMYLEGSIGGSAPQMIRSCYAVAGFHPDEGFHDLPDHVAMQLEFLGRLYERAAAGEPDCAAMAEEFEREFVHGWGAALEHACARAAGTLPAATVYRELARLLRACVADPDLERR